MTRAEWAMLLTLSVLWGGSFFFVGVAIKELPPFTIVVARVAVAAAALFAITKLLRVRLPTDGPTWVAFFGMGLLNNAIPFSLIVWGQSHIASGAASILNATTPLFTVLVAHVLTEDERLTRGRALGVLLGLGGVALLVGGAAHRSPALDEPRVTLAGVTILAHLAVLGAALSYAFASVYGRRFRRMGVTPLATATGQVCASSLILLPVALLVDRPWTLPVPAAGTAGALLGLAVFSTVLAYVLYFRILSTAGATHLVLVTFLIPVSAILLGVSFLGETLETMHVAGMALIGLGLAAIDGRPLGLLRRA